MCRILVMPGIKPENKEVVWPFIETMAGHMGSVMRDGIGYTAIKKNGDMFTERWLDPSDAFDVRPESGKKVVKKLTFPTGLDDFVFNANRNETVVDKSEMYNHIGKRTDEIVAITLHARMATSARGMKNTHPFVDVEQDTSLIHNGVIGNVTKEDNIRSTCDSERILNMYLKHKINTNPENIQKMIDELKGNFAVGIFSRDQAGVRVLDVFKTRASLTAFMIRGIGLVISTNDKDVKETCKELGLEIDQESTVCDDKHLRFVAETGEIMFVNAYKDTTTQVRDYDNWSSYNENFQSRNSGKKDKANSQEKTEEGRALLVDKLNLTEARRDNWDFDTVNKCWFRIA